MLKKIFIGLAIVVVILIVVIAVQPAAFQVTRSTTIAAPPEKVFAQVNDFHKWDAWSPWAKLDPAMNQTYEGPATGVGSVYTWNGNSQVGEGKMTITESDANKRVGIKLEFIKPVAAVNHTTFDLTPDGTNTSVVWSMAGTNNFMGKAFCLFVSMDKMVGGDFEKGLAQMKAVSETAAAK